MDKCSPTSKHQCIFFFSSIGLSSDSDWNKTEKSCYIRWEMDTKCNNGQIKIYYSCNLVLSCIFFFCQNFGNPLKAWALLDGNGWRAKREGAIGLERKTTVWTETDIRERKKQRGHEWGTNKEEEERKCWSLDQKVSDMRERQRSWAVTVISRLRVYRKNPMN